MPRRRGNLQRRLHGLVSGHGAVRGFGGARPCSPHDGPGPAPPAPHGPGPSALEPVPLSGGRRCSEVGYPTLGHDSGLGDTRRGPGVRAGPVPAPRPEAFSSWSGGRCFPLVLPPLRGAGAVGVPRSGSLGLDLGALPAAQSGNRPSSVRHRPVLGPLRGRRPEEARPSGPMAPARAGCTPGQAAGAPVPATLCAPGLPQQKARSRLKKETFINNLNSNTADRNGHSSEAYGVVRKDAGGLAAVRGRGWSCCERGARAAGPARGQRGAGLCTPNRKGDAPGAADAA